MVIIKHGDFTDLAKSYVHRVGYSGTVLKNLISYIGKDEIIIAEVGAGTGKCTECLLQFPQVKKIFAVEPTDEMRKEGEACIQDQRVQWSKGSGEVTRLESNSVDWVVMASSFHWVDTALGLKEFGRILKDGGFFTALWNPRNIEDNEFHKSIEEEIYRIAPHIQRVSSGSSRFTASLFDTLVSTGDFVDVVYVEAHHMELMSKERYMGIWNSVNDIRVQAGDKWDEILAAIKSKISDKEIIDVPYRTRAWTVQKI